MRPARMLRQSHKERYHEVITLFKYFNRYHSNEA